MGRSRKLENPSLGELWGEIRADYDAAVVDRNRRKRRGLPGSGSHADYHYRSEQHWLRILEWARDVVRNDPLVGQGIRRVVANCVREPFTLDPQSGDQALDAEIAAAWNEWGEDEACDLAGEHDFHALELLALEQMVADGDIFANLTDAGAIELIEAHRVRSPTNARGKTYTLVHGVELDDYRRRIRYWVTKEDVAPMAQVKRVGDMRKLDVRDAEGNRIVCHVYDPRRYSQTRGVSALGPVAVSIDHADDLFFAKLVQAKVASCYAVLHELPEQWGQRLMGADQRGEETTETLDDGTSRIVQGTGPGIEYYGRPGEKLIGFSPNVPNPEYFQHTMLLLGVVAVNLNLPLLVFLLDATKSNFSAWRGAMDQARIGFRCLQRLLIRRFHRPVYFWRLRHMANQEDNALGRRIAAVLEAGKLSRPRFYPPSWPYIEPSKDATADLIRRRNALISGRRWAAERGIGDYDAFVAEYCEDNARLVLAAIERAGAINEAWPNARVTWRDIAGMPTPDGVSLRLDTGAGADRGGNDNG